MKKFIILAAIFFVLAMSLFFYPLKETEWKTETLDAENAKRFISVSIFDGNPVIKYADEKSLGGVIYVIQKSTKISLLDDFFGKSYEKGYVDDAQYTGMFISSYKNHVAYQDSTMGREKLVYAYYQNGKWNREIVDDASNGLNTGVYSSITELYGRPIIFYHTEQGKKFGYALRTSTGWEKKTLENGTGWLTSIGSCGSKIFAAYRARDTSDIFLGALEDGKWISQKLGIYTSSGISLAIRDCRPYIAYYDAGKVMFLDVYENRTYQIGAGSYSTISLASNKDGFYVSYFYNENGLYYGHSADGREWETRQIIPGTMEGLYNSITVSEAGDVYIASENLNEAKFSEYNKSRYENSKSIITALSIIFFVVAVGLLVLGLKIRMKGALAINYK